MTDYNREQNLQAFVTWWQQFGKGDEKGQAQIFLDRLFKAFGHAGVQEAGGVLEDRILKKRGTKTTTAFADLVVPGRVLFEMKKRGEDLRKHYQQAFEYWLYLVPNRPTYVVLCNFDEFWVFDFNRQLEIPMDKVKIEDLPQRWGPLAFLFPSQERPTFSKENDLVAVTEEAAQRLSQIFTKLLKRVERPKAQRFVLQCMLALFAEDIGLLPRYLFTQIIEDCQNGAESSELFYLLFLAMNQPSGIPSPRFHKVAYFDGGLFSEIHPIALQKDELNLLWDATQMNWGKIRPAIFGTIFEKSMESKERRATGAQYTSEVDIQRIIQPVIVRPWRQRIEAAHSVDELRQLQQELSHYQVLDPACGSGNFLYLAYREMKRLEHDILAHIAEQTGSPQLEMGLVNAQQFWGFDINPFAVELAKVSLMIGKKLAVDELGLPEKVLPLDNLDNNLRAADAITTAWPKFDACIGNPPYSGTALSKDAEAIKRLNDAREAYPDVPKKADYCAYWFRKAHELMPLGARAGLVATNSIRQNNSRIGSLDYIVSDEGHIYEAVSSMAWSGEAKVHVSVACWSKGQPPFPTRRLWIDGGNSYIEQATINSSLSTKVDVKGAKTLPPNKAPKRTFQGQTPGEDGFIIPLEQAQKWIKTNLHNREVIFSYMTGDDLLGNLRALPNRYIVDFGDRDVIESRRYKTPFHHIENTVLPVRQHKAKEEANKNAEVLKDDPDAEINRDHENALKKWWLHFRSRSDMNKAIQKLPRSIVCSRVTKRPVFEFVGKGFCFGDSLQVFAFADDYSFGILQSNPHWAWFTERSSTLKSDFRYTPSSVFDTFPWPQNPTIAQIQAVAAAARQLHEYRRTQLNRTESRLTLRDMYASLELPGKNPLRDLHTALDAAVIAAYGFDPNADLLAQLLALNFQVAAKIEAGESVTAPGIPAHFPNPDTLISSGCILPPELL